MTTGLPPVGSPLSRPVGSAPPQADASKKRKQLEISLKEGESMFSASEAKRLESTVTRDSDSDTEEDRPAAVIPRKPIPMNSSIPLPSTSPSTSPPTILEDYCPATHQQNLRGQVLDINKFLSPEINSLLNLRDQCKLYLSSVDPEFSLKCLELLQQIAALDIKQVLSKITKDDLICKINTILDMVYISSAKNIYGRALFNPMWKKGSLPFNEKQALSAIDALNTIFLHTSQDERLLVGLCSILHSSYSASTTLVLEKLNLPIMIAYVDQDRFKLQGYCNLRVGTPEQLAAAENLKNAFQQGKRELSQFSMRELTSMLLLASDERNEKCIFTTCIEELASRTAPMSNGDIFTSQTLLPLTIPHSIHEEFEFILSLISQLGLLDYIS
ncbi:MAG: hypothetical protein V4591_10065, partial [Bdellovibrionota bacterium]